MWPSSMLEAAVERDLTATEVGSPNFVAARNSPRREAGRMSHGAAIAVDAFHDDGGSSSTLMASLTVFGTRQAGQYKWAPLLHSHHDLQFSSQDQPAMSSASTPTLLSRADSGDPRSLMDLSQELTQQNCTKEAIEVVLKHLNVNLVPNIDAGEHMQMPFKGYVSGALPCMAALVKVGLACRENPTLKSAAVPQLVQAMDGICLWSNFLLHFGLCFPDAPAPGEDFRQAYFNHALYIIQLARIDSRIRDALSTSPVLISLMLRMWMVHGKNGQEFMEVEASECPIIDLMLLATQDSMFSSNLVERIMARGGHFPLDFARSVISRSRQLVQFHVPPVHSTWFIDALVRITERLASVSLPLRRTFDKVNHLYELANTLNLISIEVPKTTRPVFLMRRINETILQLFVLCAKHPSRVVHNWRDLYEGGLYSLILRSLAHLTQEEEDEESSDVLPDILKTSGAYTMYPCVLQRLIPEAKPGVVPKVRGAKFRDSVAEFGDGLGERVTLFQMMPTGFAICDNLHCNERRLGSPMRQCSRCHTVVYCSEPCQRQDWKKLHRYECDSARLDHARMLNSLHAHALRSRIYSLWTLFIPSYLDRRSERLTYTHSSRRFHVRFVEQTFNAEYPSYQNEVASAYPALGSNEWIPIIQTTQMELHVTHQPLAPLPQDHMDYPPDYGNEGIWWDRPALSKTWYFDQVYLKPRIKELVRGFRDGTLRESLLGSDSQGDVRVAEIVLHMGASLAVCLTVLLKRENSSARWEAGYGVARYASWDEEDSSS
ncbi:hypothetical protein NMY22_g3586 [Coprinellus aureogranulatus]|nr:hypothetical protein NMY22_g3586 [Coprinellus aureogranulatus]